MRTRFIASLAFVSLVSLGCRGGGDTPEAAEGPEALPPTQSEMAEEERMAEQPMAGQRPAGQMAAACPMMVQGTNVRAEETDQGVALVFTTTGDVQDLRDRVERMAAMHEAHKAEMQQMQGMHAEPGEHGMHGHGQQKMHGKRMMMQSMMNADVRVEEVEGGARLVFVPEDPANVQELRAEVQQHAQRMSTGECPMMQMAGRRGAQ